MIFFQVKGGTVCKGMFVGGDTEKYFFRVWYIPHLTIVGGGYVPTQFLRVFERFIN